MYLPKKIAFVKTKNEKKKILFIVTWQESSVSYKGEFSVREFSAKTFSGYHFQYGPTWQRTVRIKLFLKLFEFLENLAHFKEYKPLFNRVGTCLTECCFG